MKALSDNHELQMVISSAKKLNGTEYGRRIVEMGIEVKSL